ncbi:MAG: hypothetical protein Q7S66_05830 [bacterium]|nr:hypothetical protein [bacterium]
MKKHGLFIAIEGVDGSGKKTQKDILVRRLRKAGLAVAEISFPQYGKPSAWQIEQYLNGFFGKPDEVNPYFASLLYADDRREAKPRIEEWLKKYDVVISDRYAASNAGHQGGKFANPDKRRCYLKWLWKTEFKINRIPIPDLNIILFIPPVLSQRLILKKTTRAYLKKGSRRDGHERNLDHLKHAASSYKWLAEENRKHFRLISCVKGPNLLAPEEINEKLWALIAPLLKKPK